jgi:predicted Zn-dependent peptidase
MLMNVQDSTHANGLRLVTAHMPHVESVSIGIWIGVGGRHEPRRLCGASHFIEHMLFKGTARRSARAISQAIEGRGGDLNAFTQEESTCYYARVAADRVWTAFDVLMEMVLHPRFDPRDIDKERDVILEEIMMYRDQPQHQVEEWLGELLWQDHALGRPLTGQPATLKQLTRPQIMQFKARTYTPGNTVIAMAGKIDHATGVAGAAKYLAGRPRCSKPAFGRVNGTVGQGATKMQSKDIEQTHLAIGIRLFGRSDPRRYALKLLSVILGENMSSRLFQVVRERHGFAYAIQSGVHLFADTGMLAITAGLERRRTGKAVELIVREIDKLKTTLVGSRDLGRAKDYAIGQIRLGLEGTTNQMMWVGEHFVALGHLITPEECIAALSAVTAEDIRKLAADICCTRRTSLAMIAPELKTSDERTITGHVQRLE